MKKQKNNASECAIKTSIGGQALMEGIMMRGPKKSAMAVRNPQGEIVVEEFETTGAKRPAICRWPLIRGIFGYIDSMKVGYRCLMRSAEISGLDEIVEESPGKKKKREEKETQKVLSNTDSEPSPAAQDVQEPMATVQAEQVAPESVPVNEAVVADEDVAVPVSGTEQAAPASNPAKNSEPAENTGTEQKLPAWVMTAMMIVGVVLGFALALLLFKFVPTQLFAWLCIPFPGLQGTGNVALDSLIKSAFEGVLKIILLVGYMGAISLMKEIRRTFQFHGAEHKTIFCYEAGLELTVENVRKQGRFHPRCGTSFLILMVLVNIFISFFIDPVTLLLFEIKLSVFWRSVVSLALLPFIVGLGYELIKFAGRHDNLLTRIISAPGVWLQHLTVLEPTDDMIECAIAAVKEVIPEDNSDRW